MTATVTDVLALFPKCSRCGAVLDPTATLDLIRPFRATCISCAPPPEGARAGTE